MMNRKNHFAIEHIRKYPVTFGGIIVTGFLNSCTSFLLPVSIGEFFTIHFKIGSSKDRLLGWLGLHVDSLQEFFLIFLVLMTVKFVFSYLESVASFKLSELFVKDLREKIFASQLNFDESLHRTYGKYLLRYSNDMKAVQNYFSKGILDGIKNVLFLLTGLFLLFKIHSGITSLFVGILLVISFLIYFIATLQNPFIRASRSSRSSLLAFVAKAFAEFERIKQKQSEASRIQKFNLRSDKLYEANMRNNKIESLTQAVIPFCIFTIIGILLWQMTKLYMNISASNAFIIVLILLMMQGALRKLFKVPSYLNKGRISLQKISKLLLLDLQHAISEPVK